MGLSAYRKKRDFSRSPEPKGEQRPAVGASFVVQKHDATRLHYDFRLELDGVLKSWAVPKGPSLDPADKRLAVEVEDHPVEYGGFEGVIPEGEYGAGPVLLWDRGTWIPQGDPREGYRKGTLKFRLEGSKLHGGWALVRLRPRPSDRATNWLLLKERDEDSRPHSDVVGERPESVLSGKQLQDIGVRRRKSAKAVPGVDPSALQGADRASFPSRLEPQLATLTEVPPEGQGWIHELKFDGYRILCVLRDGSVQFITRKGKDWTDRFPTLERAARELRVQSAVLDGEIVVVGEDGSTRFQALQESMGAGRESTLSCYLFDIVYCNGWSLTRVPLLERKRLLRSLLQGSPGQQRFRYSEELTGSGKSILEHACRLGLEGIVSKRADSRYQGVRSRDWLKSKCTRRQEFVVVGWTDPEGSRQGIGALLVGYYDERGSLVSAGKVGTGFSARTAVALQRQLRALSTETAPLTPAPRRAGIHWVKPQLVVEVAFTEWTRDGQLRHPSFQGVREDKSAREVTREEFARASRSRTGRTRTRPRKA